MAGQSPVERQEVERDMLYRAQFRRCRFINHIKKKFAMLEGAILQFRCDEPLRI